MNLSNISFDLVPAPVCTRGFETEPAKLFSCQKAGQRQMDPSVSNFSAGRQEEAQEMTQPDHTVCSICHPRRTEDGVDVPHVSCSQTCSVGASFVCFTAQRNITAAVRRTVAFTDSPIPFDLLELSSAASAVVRLKLN